MTKKKISVFVHDLSGNPIVRAYPLIRAMQHLGHEVEVLGFTYNTDNVYFPYRNLLSYKTIRCYLDIRWVILKSFRLSAMATGDMVYAFKGVWGSFFPALIYSCFGLRKRLLFDEEDNELWDAFIGNGWRDLWENPTYPLNPLYNYLLHPFTFLAKAKTVVCTSLQKRYGGTIVLHGPDPERYNPDFCENRISIRMKYGLPVDKSLLLFAGRPVYYNGLPFVISALQSGAEDWHLVLVGNPEDALFKEASEKLKGRCHIIGYVDHSQMPEILHACDVVPIIQTPNPSTAMQVPAKLLEAMAMGKQVICHGVADQELIIGNQRGWILKNLTEVAFLRLLQEVSNNLEDNFEKSINARQFFLAHSSYQSFAKKLELILNSIS